MTDLDARIDALTLALQDKLNARGKTFADKVRHLGRALPQSLHRAADTIQAARLQSDHPRLQGRIDQSALDQAFDDFDAFLARIDPAERRATRIIGIAASYSFGLILLVGVALAFARWRGLI